MYDPIIEWCLLSDEYMLYFDILKHLIVTTLKKYMG